MFRAKPLTLRRLLAGQYHYRLPRFQRHYAWTEKVVTRLLDDLQVARGENSASGGPRTTFLGAIIVIQSSALARTDRLFGRRQYDIIDGQQRLITLTLLLSIIRDLLPSKKQQSIRRTIVGANPAEIPYRLTLRKVDEELFERVAKTPGATLTDPEVDTSSDTARNMMTTRQILRDFLIRIEESVDDDLESFAKYVLDNCQIALIEADHHDDANQIYEALNHSGVPLQLSNHIKTLAFRGTEEGDDKIDALATEWDKWERQLTIRRFNRLFSIIRALESSGTGPVATENERIIKQVGGCKPYLNNVVRPAVEGYLRILDTASGSVDEHPEIRRYLTCMSWLSDTDWIGPVLRWFQVGPNDEVQTIEFLRRMDRLAFSLMILGINVAGRAARFKKVIDAIDKSGIPASQTALDLTKEEQSTVLYRLSNDFQRKGGRACKLVLLRVSDKLGDTLTQKVPLDLTVEHTLPRTVNNKKEWTQHFASTAEMQLCFKRFANMVLLPQRINQRVKNEGFQAKVKKIFYPGGSTERRLTPYPLTNYLADCQTWDAQTINAREAELFKIIKEMWDLKGKSGQETDKEKPPRKTRKRKPKK